MSAPTEAQICRVVAEALGLDAAEITGESSMETVEGWDSLQHLSVIVAIEAEFECALSPEQVGELSSIAQISAFLGEVGP